jgi:hypothetical protein
MNCVCSDDTTRRVARRLDVSIAHTLRSVNESIDTNSDLARVCRDFVPSFGFCSETESAFDGSAPIHACLIPDGRADERISTISETVFVRATHLRGRGGACASPDLGLHISCIASWVCVFWELAERIISGSKTLVTEIQSVYLDLSGKLASFPLVAEHAPGSM